MAQLDLPATFVTRIELAGPGFINFWLAGDALSAQVREIVEQGPAYGKSTAGAGVRPRHGTSMPSILSSALP